jgi:hypothetical protein
MMMRQAENDKNGTMSPARDPLSLLMTNPVCSDLLQRVYRSEFILLQECSTAAASSA